MIQKVQLNAVQIILVYLIVWQQIDLKKDQEDVVGIQKNQKIIGVVFTNIF